MYKIKPLITVNKEIRIPPDKSISHRALIISSLAFGSTRIEPLLKSDDTFATLDCIKKCGVKITLKDKALDVEGKGMYFSTEGKINLYASGSGTTIRILSGILCGQKNSSFMFSAAPSLKRRPMNRIVLPLRLMGADIKGKIINCEEYPPLEIKPVKSLKGIKYKLLVASAQVKSSIILASLYAQGITKIYEPLLSRDHTERMLALFRGKTQKKGKTIIVQCPQKLYSPGEIFIPSDFSSAAFFIVLGLILKNSELLIKNVNINPTRCGLLKVLNRMSAQIKIIEKKEGYEPYADILVKSSRLKAVEIKEDEIPSMIDEIPVLCVAASFAKGQTRILGAGELRVKETDRIKSITYNLKKIGINISSQKYLYNDKENWMIEVTGGGGIKTADFKSFSDHRTAMSMIIFGKASDRENTIDDIKCIDKSFPEFISLVESL